MHNEIQSALTIGEAWLTSIPSHAISYAQWVLARDPLNGIATAQLIEAYLKTGKTKQAMNLTETAIPFLDADSIARIALLHNKFKTGNSPQSAAEFILSSKANADAGNLDTAITECEMAIDLRPNWYLTHLQHGILTNNETSFEKALLLAPPEEFNTCFQHLCTCLFAKNKVQTVAHFLSQYNDSFGIQYIIQQAIWYLHTNPPEAFSYLDLSVNRIAPQDRFQILVYLHEQTQNLPNANLVWQYLAKETPYWGSPLQALAGYYVFHNKPEKAKAIMERLAIMQPENWEHRVALGSITGDEKHYIDAISLAPYQEPGAIIPYALFLTQRGDYTKAIDLLMPCVEANPENNLAAKLLSQIGRKACDSLL